MDMETSTKASNKSFFERTVKETELVLWLDKSPYISLFYWAPLSY